MAGVEVWALFVVGTFFSSVFVTIGSFIDAPQAYRKVVMLPFIVKVCAALAVAAVYAGLTGQADENGRIILRMALILNELSYALLTVVTNMAYSGGRLGRRISAIVAKWRTRSP